MPKNLETERSFLKRMKISLVFKKKNETIVPENHSFQTIVLKNKKMIFLELRVNSDFFDKKCELSILLQIELIFYRK